MQNPDQRKLITEHIQSHYDEVCGLCSPPLLTASLLLMSREDWWTESAPNIYICKEPEGRIFSATVMHNGSVVIKLVYANFAPMVTRVPVMRDDQ